MIELTTFHGDEKIFVNPEKIQIIYAYKNDEHDGSQINFDTSSVKVKEDIFTVMQMIINEKMKKEGELNG